MATKRASKATQTKAPQTPPELPELGDAPTPAPEPAGPAPEGVAPAGASFARPRFKAPKRRTETGHIVATDSITGRGGVVVRPGELVDEKLPYLTEAQLEDLVARGVAEPELA